MYFHSVSHAVAPGTVRRTAGRASRCTSVGPNGISGRVVGRLRHSTRRFQHHRPRRSNLRECSQSSFDNRLVHFLSLPQRAFYPSHPSHASVHAGPVRFRPPSRNPFVTDRKSRESPMFMWVVTHVTFPWTDTERKRLLYLPGCTPSHSGPRP
jgi:hypothetical protein